MANATTPGASDDFARVTLAVMRDGPPSCGDNLDGMALDIDARLWHLDEIESDSIIVKSTPHAERLLRASCYAAAGVTVSDAIEAVEQIWITDLSYRFLEAHRVVIGATEAELNFITQIGPGRFFVTGQIEVLRQPAPNP